MRVEGFRVEGLGFRFKGLRFRAGACQGCVRGASGARQGASGARQGRVRGVSGACQGRVRGVSGACQGRVRGVSGACQGRVRGVSGACQGGSVGARRKIRPAAIPAPAPAQPDMKQPRSDDARPRDSPQTEGRRWYWIQVGQDWSWEWHRPWRSLQLTAAKDKETNPTQSEQTPSAGEASSSSKRKRDASP